MELYGIVVEVTETLRQVGDGAGRNAVPACTVGDFVVYCTVF